MENDIVKGIAKALRDAFGPGYRIYQNDIEQGFQTPCFFILPMKATPSPLGKDRFLLKSPFDVHFFPEDEKDNAIMQSIAWQLWQALEFITLPGGDKLHGTSMSWSVHRGTGCLHRAERRAQFRDAAALLPTGSSPAPRSSSHNRPADS